MLRRVLAVLIAIIVTVGGLTLAVAQTEPVPSAPLGTWCPALPSNAQAGQPVQCKVVADPYWTPPTTQPPTSTTTSTTVPTTTTTTPVTTTTVPTTTTSTPPASLMGWQLTASNIGLAPHGLSCSSLPLYTGPNRPDRGTTITGWRIEKYIDMSNGDVTLDKVCLRPRTQGTLGALASTTVEKLIGGEVRCCFYGLPAGTTATIKDSEIDGSLISAGNVAGANGFDGGANLYRNYIHDTGSGIAFRETGTQMSFTVENNYVHRLRHAGDAHHDGGTVRDFLKNSTNTRTLVWRNNRLDSRNTSGAWETAAFFLQPTWSGYGVHNVRLEGNFLEGRAYNLALEQSNGGHSGSRSINNRFWQPDGCTPTNGCYGHSSVSGSPGWAEWIGNYRYDATKFNAQGIVVNP